MIPPVTLKARLRVRDLERLSSDLLETAEAYGYKELGRCLEVFLSEETENSYDPESYVWIKGDLLRRVSEAAKIFDREMRTALGNRVMDLEIEV